MTDLLAQETLALEDERVQLRPIALADVEKFANVAFAPRIWSFFIAAINTLDDLRGFVQEAVDANGQGRALALTVIDKASGMVAGSTRLANWSARDERVEIGWTWLGEKFQGTGLNARCKFLLMQHAFERHHVQRVEFKTDVLNLPARRALNKIGATEEGVLRSHTLMPGGRRRDTIYYSVLQSEWPSAKQLIRASLGRKEARGDAHA